MALPLSETDRWSLALLLDLEEDFPGCLEEMAAVLPVESALRKFIDRAITPTQDSDVAA